jgi:hypothetical protein
MKSSQLLAKAGSLPGPTNHTMLLRSQVLLCTFVFACTLSGFSQLPVCPQIRRSTDLPATLDSLTAPGSPPFHLKAVIHEGNDPDSKTEVEVFWNSPQQYRRTIKGDEFSQRLIINADLVFEQDSDDYFPLWAQTLVRAMVDLGSVKDLINAGTYGHWLVLDRFQDFKGRAVPRMLEYVVDCGDTYRAEITELKSATEDAKSFNVKSPTLPQERLVTARVPQSELASDSDSLDVIWPQTLDGAESGEAYFYISTDRTGKVREVLPLQTANERTNDSARRQIARWKLKPITREGAPVQIESVLRFRLNTRFYGPAEPLSNEEARKLASDVVEPQFPTGKVESGHLFNCRVAVDSDGQVIEIIPSGSVPGVPTPCLGINKWHFRPVVENGAPRPYRALITFTAP